MSAFVRFEGTVPNARGAHPGVFALANGLAADGRLTAEDHRWWRAANDRANDLYPSQTESVPDCYDRVLHPGAVAWFRTTALPLIAFARPYLSLLDRYGVPWRERRTDDPGRIVSADEVQVVATPA